MLQLFHMNIAKVDWDVAYVFAKVSSVFQVFLQGFKMHVSSVPSTFRHTLKVLHLNISKVDQVLHLPLAFFCLASVSPPPPSAGWASAISSLSSRKTMQKNDCRRRHPDIQVLASPFLKSFIYALW